MKLTVETILNTNPCIKRKNTFLNSLPNNYTNKTKVTIEHIIKHNGLYDTLSLLFHLNEDSYKDIFSKRLMVVHDIAKDSLHFFEKLYPEDKRPHQALEMVIKIAKKELIGAAAWDAAGKAARAAGRAAWAAARAAWEATWDADGEAARADGEAARAAGESAWAAAWEAARAAAGEAARAAAGAAAGGTAWEAAWDAAGDAARDAGQAALEAVRAAAGEAARAARAAAWAADGAAARAAWEAAWDAAGAAEDAGDAALKKQIGIIIHYFGTKKGSPKKIVTQSPSAAVKKSLKKNNKKIVKIVLDSESYKKAKDKKINLSKTVRDIINN